MGTERSTMKLTVTRFWWKARARYALRIRGSELSDAMIAALAARGVRGRKLADRRGVADSRSVDTSVIIDDEAFTEWNWKRRKWDPKTQSMKNADLALEYALDVQRQLLEQATAIEARATHAAAVTATGPTVASLWKLYRELNAARLKASTLVRNANQAKQLVRYFDETLQLAPSSITIAKAERYVVWRGEQGVSPRTVWGEISFLVQLLGWAIERPDETGVTSIALRKVPKIRGKRGGRRRKVMLTAHQFFSLFEAAAQLPRRGDVIRRLIGFGGTARLRKTPLLGMQGEWIDRRRAWLTVPAELNKGRGDDYREIAVPLPKFAMALIEDLPESGPLWPSMFQRVAAVTGTELVDALSELQSDDRARDALIVILTKRYRIRLVDVASLRWSQVSLITGFIEGVRCRVWRGESEKPIVLTSADLDLLAETHAARRSEEFVFVTRSGRPPSQSFVMKLHDRLAQIVIEKRPQRSARTMTMNNPRSLQKACSLAGTPLITLHDLRRTGNHIMEAHRCPKHPAGVPKELRERLLGHSQGALDSAYSLITEEMLRWAVSAYDEEWEAFHRDDSVASFAEGAASRRATG
jgi:hypothetical protein